MNELINNRCPHFFFLLLIIYCLLIVSPIGADDYGQNAIILGFDDQFDVCFYFE